MMRDRSGEAQPGQAACGTATEARVGQRAPQDALERWPVCRQKMARCGASVERWIGASAEWRGMRWGGQKKRDAAGSSWTEAPSSRSVRLPGDQARSGTQKGPVPHPQASRANPRPSPHAHNPTNGQGQGAGALCHGPRRRGERAGRGGRQGGRPRRSRPPGRRRPHRRSTTANRRTRGRRRGSETTTWATPPSPSRPAPTSCTCRTCRTRTCRWSR